MFELYRKSQQVQYNWIRNHPVQYVALNAALIVAAYGYMKYMDRRDQREYETETAELEA